MSALSASIAAAIAVSVSTQTLPTPQLGTDDVIINEVSVDPWESGITATAVGVSGTAAGERRFYFIPFMTVGQAKPHVGDRCEISWQWYSGFDWLLGDGGSVREGRMVTDFHCEPGSQ